MSNFKASQRYATSLMQVAIERNEVEIILEDVKLIDNTLQDSRELVLFLKSPIIKRDKKFKVLNQLFGKQINELTRAFLEIMTRKGRENLLPSVFASFIRQYNEYAGIIDIKVVSARKLTKKETTELQKVLEQTTSKRVQLHLKEDTSLIGGLMIRIVDTVIDGTVKHKLEQLESLMLSTGI